jgi:hypothetical protein
MKTPMLSRAIAVCQHSFTPSLSFVWCVNHKKFLSAVTGGAINMPALVSGKVKGYKGNV